MIDYSVKSTFYQDVHTYNGNNVVQVDRDYYTYPTPYGYVGVENIGGYPRIMRNRYNGQIMHFGSVEDAITYRYVR